MDTDEQKNKTTESKLSERHQLNASYVFSTTGIRSAIQDALRLHWELLGYRYHILLLVRAILAIVLASTQVL
jgi:hypothetical protein